MRLVFYDIDLHIGHCKICHKNVPLLNEELQCVEHFLYGKRCPGSDMKAYYLVDHLCELEEARELGVLDADWFWKAKRRLRAALAWLMAT